MVDSRLKDHVNNFYIEGEKRGKKLQKDNLVITLKKGLRNTNKRIGITAFDRDFTGQITVYIDEEYYLNESIPNECKESTVFHELGHAVLLRKTHTDQIPSIMNSSNRFHCYKMSSDGESIKEQLLNELFQ